MLLIGHWSHVVILTNSGQPQEMRHISPLLHWESHGLHIAQWNVMPDCRHSHICFLEQRRGSLQRAPSRVRGMCARMRREFETGGLPAWFIFKGECWECVERLRSWESSLRSGLGFTSLGHCWGFGVRSWGGGILYLDNSTNKAEYYFLCARVCVRGAREST